VPWRFRGLEPLLDRWERDDRPEPHTRLAVLTWLIGLQDDPRPPESAPVPGVAGDVWVGDAPGTAVSFLYEIHEDGHEVWAVMLETLER